MVPLHSPEVSETVRTGRNIDLSAELSETRAISTDISKYFYKRNNNKKRLLYRTEPIFPMLTGLFQVCANKNAQVFRIDLALF